MRRRRRWDLGTTQKHTKTSNHIGIRCSEDGYAVVNHNRSEYAVVTRCNDSDPRCSDADTRCNDIVSLTYAVVKVLRCIVEQVEDPKKWLTNLRLYAIIYPHDHTVRESEASPYCSSSEPYPMWNNHAFTVSTMAHGRGLNAVFF